MNAPGIIVGVIVSVLVGRAVFPLFFEDHDDFVACFGSALTPDFISFFRGEFLEDWARSWKLSFYFLVAGGAGILAAMGVEELLRSLGEFDWSWAFFQP